MNIFSLLDQAASARPDVPAVAKGAEVFVSFAQLRDRSLRLAAGMAAHAKPGDRVLVAAKNCPEYVEILFAAWAAGLVAVPLNAKLHVEEMLAIAEDSEPVLCLASSGIASELAGRIGSAPIIVIGSPEYDGLMDNAPAGITSRNSADVAWLFYTSGTTGRSKGAMLTHGNLLAMTEAHWADIDDPAPGTSLIHAAPMSHGSGLYILPYLARGATQVVPASGGFEPAEMADLWQAWPDAAMFLAPTMVKRLREHFAAADEVPAGLRLIVYGGGPMYLAEIKQSLAMLGPRLAQIYGQGETPMTISGLDAASHVDASDHVLGSVGYARSGVDLRIVDEDGNDLPTGEAGEIICRSPTVMAGYWNMPEATSQTLQDGWLATGDVGKLDADGVLTITDRTKDLIISGGSNIYPREVEEVLLAHPHVTEVSVVGDPDVEWGEVVVAHLVASGAVDEKELDAHCLAQIARFKRPKRYVFHDELPKNAYGKILKRSLRQSDG